jgi:hypothetical protein
MYNKNEQLKTPEKSKYDEAVQRMNNGLFAELDAGDQNKIEARRKAAAEILG